MKAYEMLQHLLSGRTLSLAAWLADPLPASDAETWSGTIRQQLRTCHARGRPCFQVRLAEIIARHWRGQDTAMNYQNLLAILDSDRHRAQLDLCYGQLLIACKRLGAWRYLDDGFQRSANLLGSEEYFTVLRRHNRLRYLSLSENGADPVELDGLLREAAVISRLTGRGRRLVNAKHQDTVD